MSVQALEQALCYPKQEVFVDAVTKNIMSVNVPVFTPKLSEEKNDIYPYGLAFTSGELDRAVGGLASVMPKLLELAQTEKAVMLLAEEIEKTRRRVNALEHVMIPEQEETIKYIVAKLDEDERSNTSRLMKVKEMVLERPSEKA